MTKSTIQEIEARFDQDVERFSKLETGQQTTLDASLNMELITSAIARRYPGKTKVLDIGCGAGNFPVKLAGKNPEIEVTLVDLSQPMLNRAEQRVAQVANYKPVTKKGDFRSVDFKGEQFDVIIATAVLHHLRDDKDWETAFNKLFHLLKDGGSIWIFDLVEQTDVRLQQYIYKELYGDYLSGLKDQVYRDHVFSYIEKEDSPRSLVYQLNLLQKVGFQQVDVLHKNLCFASFVGFKKP
ncbi:tRNA (cmo5U34)-methyltransferase [Arachidicoccus rhizosphaerae]|jgi:tRNA (cmo5U34)-methyltransferase|uniref:tRNA (Cmo5U34)-methyltransferase n=1 Tax=Arachidicoccus rhizosphaerae TaxID=551991 RepID=A0A1H3WLJ4_9BACT|nr:class I SAM-dependent methyltransferase [Arachidicoccus rhizosphaerae]SDZ88003.1 tRNA (cmo5U34)-methyltransferase [Arachidicoccus rhizosphaerae]